MAVALICVDLDVYRNQAEQLLASFEAGDADAVSRVAPYRNSAATPTLADTQLTLAREHDFETWSQFEHAVRLAPSLKDALDPGDPVRARDILAEVPQLANLVPWPQHRPNTRALEIVSDACVWHRPLKHQIALALIEAGASCDIAVAARAGALDHVRALLDAQPELSDFRDMRGRSALYRASCVYGAFKEGEAVAELLIERGAVPDLFVASTYALPQNVEELLSEDPDLARSKDPDGMTALHWAVRPRRVKVPENPVRVTRLLLEAGVDVSATDPTQEEMQAIHHVGEWSATRAQAELLLEYGADVNAKSAIGWTPLDYALDRSRVEIAEYLVSRGGRESGARS